jgi:PAS domain S-box-containing protein
MLNPEVDVALEERERRVLDRLSLAAIKLDAEQRIVYLNPAATELIGALTDVRGTNVYEIFRRNAVTSEQLKKRSVGEAAVYDTECVRQSDGKSIPVSIAGTPLFDDDNRYVGTLDILRSLERERTSEAIHGLIETEHDYHALIEGVARELHTLLPFDNFSVNEHSRHGRSISILFSSGMLQLTDIGRRWWRVPKDRASEYNTPLIVNDFPAFIRERRPEYRNDVNVNRYLDAGFQSMIRIPILESGSDNSVRNTFEYSSFTLQRGTPSNSDGSSPEASDPDGAFLSATAERTAPI